MENLPSEITQQEFRECVKRFGAFYKICLLINMGVRLIRRSPFRRNPRNVHWLYVRPPRPERYMIAAMLGLLVVASAYSMEFVVVVGSLLSFGVILWSMLRLARSL